MTLQRDIHSTGYYQGVKELLEALKHSARQGLPVKGVEGGLHFSLCQPQLASQTLNNPSATCIKEGGPQLQLGCRCVLKFHWDTDTTHKARRTRTVRTAGHRKHLLVAAHNTSAKSMTVSKSIFLP